eukprot:TRINITY_DN13239_c0_g1_i2.p1 TRINITY_DN13239_c0_g1~~TRINITY_DN13239_c0_g1_i2.p1  ORF type:complete len:167 (+),score=33.68 TRINITY_DN13239_c0_g1_i2:299-799(+)
MLQLGKEHYPSDVVFPIDFLIPLLESWNGKLEAHLYLDFTRFWVCGMMLEIGIPHHNLFHIYNNLANQQEGDEKVHTLLVLLELVVDWQSHLLSTSGQSDVRFYQEVLVGQVIDRVGTFIRAKPADDENRKICERFLKLIHANHSKLPSPTMGGRYSTDPSYGVIM